MFILSLIECQSEKYYLLKIMLRREHDMTEPASLLYRSKELSLEG